MNNSHALIAITNLSADHWNPVVYPCGVTYTACTPRIHAQPFVKSIVINLDQTHLMNKSAQQQIKFSAILKAAEFDHAPCLENCVSAGIVLGCEWNIKNGD